MTWRGHPVLAVIPARIGSKGIPKKNLVTIAGKSLLEHAIDFAEQNPWIDMVAVSTDSEEIARVRPEITLITPPGYLHSDTCKSVDVWKHAWLEVEDADEEIIDHSVLLEPTSPLRTHDDIAKCLAMLDRHPAACTVSKTQAKHAPEKQILAKEKLEFYKAHHRRQDVPGYYHLNGICYAARRTPVMQGTLFEDCGVVLADHVAVNIDDWHDMDLADWFMKQRQIDS